ncbi:MAG: 3-oxoadipate enol-lactonase [Alphaproteobacteria bacterium]|jgi:3-oxoadipate enol-lactonase|nr:3-oxoadipate enol-lactonase [Alphaproteobacteria bacterium]
MQIEVNGNTTNYEVSGVQDGPVVMLSHSLACSGAMWRPQLPALEARYRVVNYDTRGHGASGAPDGPYSLDMLGDDALALMTALDIDAAHWVGLSMGGMIGQNIALRQPERLRSLTLCDTSSQIPAEAHQIWHERIDIARQSGMAALLDPTLQRWFTAPFLAAADDQVAPIRAAILATPVAGYTGCSEAIRNLDYTGRLGEIDKPTLIIVGEDDQGTPVAASEAINAGIAGSKLVVLPQAAHLSNIEQADAFTAALVEFLGGLDG